MNHFAPSKPTGREILSRAAVAAVLLLTAGCATFKRPEVKLPEIDFNIRFSTKPTALSAPIPSSALTLFDSDDFCPPGGRRILPPTPVRVKYGRMPNTNFPSSLVSVSPDSRWAVETYSRRRAGFLHYLTVTDQKNQVAREVCVTRYAMDESWSPSSVSFALTEYHDKNASAVYLMDPLGKFSCEVDPSSVLLEYFANWCEGSPRTVRAYAWTPSGGLIVRGLGQQQIPPHTLFGYELLIEVTPDNRIKTNFIRGFIKIPPPDVPAAVTPAPVS